MLECGLDIDEKSKYQKPNNEFKKREKGQVIYVVGKKLVPVSMVWKGQMVPYIGLVYARTFMTES